MTGLSGKVLICELMNVLGQYAVISDASRLRAMILHNSRVRHDEQDSVQRELKLRTRAVLSGVVAEDMTADEVQELAAAESAVSNYQTDEGQLRHVAAIAARIGVGQLARRYPGSYELRMAVHHVNTLQQLEDDYFWEMPEDGLVARAA